MVSRRRGDHASVFLIFGKQKYFVEGSAFLVGTGHLQVFELEVNRVTSELRKGLRANKRRQENRIADARDGSLNCLQRDHLKEAQDGVRATLTLYMGRQEPEPENWGEGSENHRPCAPGERGTGADGPVLGIVTAMLLHHDFRPTALGHARAEILFRLGGNRAMNVGQIGEGVAEILQVWVLHTKHDG